METVFDLTTQPMVPPAVPGVLWVLVPLILSMLLVVGWRWRYGGRQRRRQHPLLPPVHDPLWPVIAGLSVLMGVPACSYYDYYRGYTTMRHQRDDLVAAHVQGQSRVVEGPVEVQTVARQRERPFPREVDVLPTDDLIVVGGHRFALTPFRGSQLGYTTTIVRGGVLRPGISARITYVPMTDGPDTIIKVEIKR